MLSMIDETGMSFDEFCNYVESNILEYVDAPENTSVNIMEVAKQNDEVLHGLQIRTAGMLIAPLIYLEPFYERLGIYGDLEWALKTLADSYSQAVPGELRNMEFNFEYEKIRDRIEVVVVDKQLNEKRLELLENVSLGNDMYATFNIVVSNGEDGLTTIPVPKQIAEHYAYDFETMLSDAERNMLREHPPTLMSLDDIMMEMMLNTKVNKTRLADANDMASSMELVVFSNELSFRGASIFWLGDIRKRIGDILQNNYYVIPSSIHELILVPEGKGPGIEELYRMVRQINTDMVEQKDLLSYKIFFYDRNLDKLSIACGQKPCSLAS